MPKKDKGKRPKHGRSTGKNRRAAEPGVLYTTTAEEQAAKSWRDRLGTDMRTQVGFTESTHTAVLFCIPTHELHFPDDGSATTNTWVETLTTMRFQRVTDLRRLGEIEVDVDWTVQLGPATRHPVDPQFVTLTGAVRGPSVTGNGVDLFYQGEINTSGEWIEQAKSQNKMLIVAPARDGVEHWAAAAHLNRPKNR